MARLTPEQQTFILTALACYDTPTMVMQAVKDEFGVEISKQQMNGYDPTTVNGNKNLSQKNKDLFFRVREEFKRDVSAIPIANKAYRLRSLQRFMEQAAEKRNYVLAAQFIDQAAREVGDDKALDNEERRLRIEKMKRDLSDDKEDGAPTPVAVNINVVDARKRDDSSDA